jgi:hypothetical protein
VISTIDYRKSIIDWIEEHKLTTDDSNSVFIQFMSKAKIKGSGSFLSTMEKVIKKASELVTGRIVFKRMLATNKEIVIEESETETQYVNGKEILLSFHKLRGFEIMMNEQGEWEINKAKKVASFIHECIHKLHWDTNENGEYEKRVSQDSFMVDMDDQEEELTIMGMINQGKDGKYSIDASENTVITELALTSWIGYRCTHKGLGLAKNENPTLWDMISLRAMGSLKKAIEDSILNKDEISSKYRNQAPFDYALYHWLRELDPIKQKQYEEIIKVLIQAGFKSNIALKIAILQNSTEIVDLLIKSGTKPSDDLLELCQETFRAGLASELLRKAGWKLPSFHSDVLYSPEVERRIKLEQSNFSQKFYRGELPEKIIEILVKAGAKPSEKLFSLIVRKNLLQLVKIFIEFRFSIPKDILKEAIEIQLYEMVGVLIEAGVNPSKYDLKCAISSRNIKIIEQIMGCVENSQKVLTESNNSRKVFKKAIKAKSIKIIEILLQVNKPSQEHLKRAILTKDIKIIELILNHAKDPEKAFKKAVKTKSIEIIEAFIKVGVKPSEEVLKLAISLDNIEIVEKLIHYGANPTEILKQSQSLECSNEMRELLKQYTHSPSE